MSQQPAGGATIEAGRCRRLKVLYILETAGQEVLTYTLQCGMRGKVPTDTLEQYLTKLPQDSKTNYIREQTTPAVFKEDMSQIKKDPSCTAFDISLVYKAIKLACEDVAGCNEMDNNVSKWSSKTLVQGCELEHFTNKIKTARDIVVHECKSLTEAAFRDKVTELTDSFDSCMRATKDRYGVDEGDYQNKRNAVLAKVAAIRDEYLGEDEILRRSAKNMLPFFKVETDTELKDRLDRAKYLTPLDFFDFENRRVEARKFFCDIDVAEKTTAISGAERHVHYLEMLQLCNDAVVRPQVLLVEGEAGSGKSALATFLLAEWLAPQQDRRVQGLDNFDLVMWAVCRHESSTTLQDFVKKLLPKSDTRYGHLLLPLLRQCRVLLIIDGLDDRNDDTNKLVNDILSQAEATTFTIVCTSRPEGMQGMETRLASNFKVSHIKLKGITHAMRTELVIQNYQCISGNTINADDEGYLRQLVENSRFRSLFSLPLILLFLGALFSDKGKNLRFTTHHELYQQIHEWCVQKLQELLASRLALRSQYAVKRVLSTVYKVALKGVLEARLYLNDQDMTDVSDACIGKDLNHDEILSAFFIQRREESCGIEMVKYQAPHKGLQEYLAAKYIFEQVTQYREGAIERVLNTHADGKLPPVYRLQNTLSHLARVLASQCNAVTPAIREIVDLLRRLRFGGHGPSDQWLGILATIDAPDVLVQGVADSFDKSHCIHVISQAMYIASVMLQHLRPPRDVIMTLHHEPAHGLDDLLRVLPHHRVMIINLMHHFRDPDQHASGTLLHSVPRSLLRRFSGNLEHHHLRLLPSCLKTLKLAVRDTGHARSLLPALAATLPELPTLQIIGLHIPVAKVNPGALTPLPLPQQTDVGTSRLNLTLTGVTDQLVEDARDIVAALTPPEGRLKLLMFPGATLKYNEWQNFFEKLEQSGVKVFGSVHVPDSYISVDEAQQLDALARTMLGGKLIREVSSNMWWWI